jgi:hypothetical protein
MAIVSVYRMVEIENGEELHLGSIPANEPLKLRFAYSGGAGMEVKALDANNCEVTAQCIGSGDPGLVEDDGQVEVSIQPSGQAGDHLSVGIAIESPGGGVVASWSVVGEIS